MNSINWSELSKIAEDGGFQTLPNGEYDVYVASASGGKTSTGKDRIRVTFKVENGPRAGATVTNDFVLSPENANAMSIFFRHATALGLTSDYFAANPNAPIDKVAADLQAKRSRVRLRLSTRTWQSQERNNVDAVLPALPGTAGVSPVTNHHTPAAAVPTVSQPQPVPQVPQAVVSEALPIPEAPVLPDDLPF
jgi:hypothetical protein